MKVYDKATWHIDGGESSEEVLKKFHTIFTFLNEKKMLSSEGLEIFKIVGIDSSIVLHDRLLTSEGNKFLEYCSDKIINYSSSEIQYQIETVYKNWHN